jgi:hypothetical protein
MWCGLNSAVPYTYLKSGYLNLARSLLCSYHNYPILHLGELRFRKLKLLSTW